MWEVMAVEAVIDGRLWWQMVAEAGSIPGPQSCISPWQHLRPLSFQCRERGRVSAYPALRFDVSLAFRHGDAESAAQ